MSMISSINRPIMVALLAEGVALHLSSLKWYKGGEVALLAEGVALHTQMALGDGEHSGSPSSRRASPSMI